MAMVRLLWTRMVFAKHSSAYLLLRELSATITKAERDIAVERLAVYEKWFSDKVLKVGKNDTIVIIPIEDMTPRYRDEPLGFVLQKHFSCIEGLLLTGYYYRRYFNPVGVPMLFLSPILKAPELVVPGKKETIL
jgi:hypothetical protein